MELLITAVGFGAVWLGIALSGNKDNKIDRMISVLNRKARIRGEL
jgi:hypothetical protein